MSTSQDRVAAALQDRYEIEEVLGRGGSAVVYLATDRLLERPVAIKVLRAAPAAGEDGQDRLRREAHIVARLQHPNIIQLFDIRTLDDDGLALIMQYVQGVTLKRLVAERGPLPCDVAGRILVDAAQALAYAHAQKIVHRDMKPDNVFYDQESGRTQVSDFGIARRWGGASTLTLPGSALGTPAYMSPEQIDGQELDGRSDLYSLGLLGYEILTGRPPWGGETLFAVLEKQKRDTLAPLEQVRPDVPHHLSEAIRIALQKDPGDRWPDAGVFADRIRAGPLPDTSAPLAPRTSAPLEDAPTVVFRTDGVPPAEPRPDAPDATAPPPAPPTGGRSSINPVPVWPPRAPSSGPGPMPSVRERVPGGFHAPPGAPGAMDLPEDTEYYTREDSAQPGATVHTISVTSPLDFERVIRYDVYQLLHDDDILFSHLACGDGEVQIHPPAYVTTRRGKSRRVETPLAEPVTLVCTACDARFDVPTRDQFEIVLTRFLARPRPSAIEAYRLTEEVSFVDPAWQPPRRRRRPDRRTPETRYEVDPSLVGRRRSGRDRRRDPDVRDRPPSRPDES